MTIQRIIRGFLSAVLCLLSFLLLASILLTGSAQSDLPVYAVPDIKRTFDRSITTQVNQILGTTVPEQPRYTLQDYDLVAPRPNPECYGEVADPAQMQPILEKAHMLLHGESTLFTPDTVIQEGSSVRYYLDDSIFAVAWKQVVDSGVYTFAEIKLAHPSQFRRFFSEGSYGSNVLHTTTEMSESVNAVVAASGDYYGYRTFGIVVNNAHIYRDRGELLDTCFIDENGDLLFTYAGDLTGTDNIQEFIDDHQIRFSLCFGPVMIENGEYCVPDYYNSGEVDHPYARAALCQLGPMHYMVVSANQEKGYYRVPTIRQFAQRLHEMGIPKAYALDGGQTASIAMDHQLVNQVSYGSQRKISDILYFATAIPESASQGGVS